MKQGLKITRLMMVISSLSPLFILWAIHGNTLVPEKYFLGFCAIMVLAPYLFLSMRINTAIKHRELKSKTVGKAEDHRDHLLVYLFAMLLPFYAADFDDFRAMAAVLVAIIFIVFLFWHLNLHYMNLVFALAGYNVFTVYPVPGDNPVDGKMSFVLITKRNVVSLGEKIDAYRLSDTVYFEKGE